MTTSKLQVGEKPLFIACDIRSTSGEGRLALSYMESVYGVQFRGSVAQFLSQRHDECTVVSPECPTLPRWKHSLLSYGWLIRQLINIRRWKSKNVVVLNYLPLWNSLFFLLVPKRVHMGPITGGGKINPRHLGSTGIQRQATILLRNFVTPYLYAISRCIITSRGMTVKPATPSVSSALGFDSSLPRAIEAATLPLDFMDFLADRRTKKLDLVCYVGTHPLKNSRLTIQTVNALAASGFKVAVIGPLTSSDVLQASIQHFNHLDYRKTLTLISQSVVVFTLSLEQAGFFSLEASYMGVPVLCLPESGGACLPGAIILASAEETLSSAMLSPRAAEAIRSTREYPETHFAEISAATRELHDKAKLFFNSDQ